MKTPLLPPSVPPGVLAIGLAAGLLATPSATADPMRPLQAPSRAASAATVGAAAAATAARPLPPLVAIRTDSQGRRQALLGERWVAEGDRLDQATVVAVDALGVRVRQGKADTVLHLLPPLQPVQEPERLAEAPAQPRPRAPGSARR